MLVAANLMSIWR